MKHLSIVCLQLSGRSWRCHVVLLRHSKSHPPHDRGISHAAGKWKRSHNVFSVMHQISADPLSCFSFLDVCRIRFPSASTALGHRSVLVLWAALAGVVRRVSRRRHSVSLPPLSPPRPPQPTAVPAGPGERPPSTCSQTSTDSSTSWPRLERIQHAPTSTPSHQHRCSFPVNHTTVMGLNAWPRA